jgi:hypothetical protein
MAAKLPLTSSLIVLAIAAALGLLFSISTWSAKA